MLQQGLAVLQTGFYPFGNTPAVCLTQHLPPEVPARVLILGCGDLRNVLFTNHSEGGRRKLDFTCCDIEASVIARGILLITLITDDTGGHQTFSNWNIYFHQYLSFVDHARLVSQAKKLRSLSGSLDAWKTSEYGNVIRFCDKSTLEQVSKVWDFYLDASNRSRVEAKMKSERLGDSYTCMNGIRSTAPAFYTGFQAILDMHESFRKHGSTDADLATVSQATKHPNPMLVSPRIAAKLHGGENPLLGFHLATAFVPLDDKSAYAKAYKQKTNLGKAVAAARTEFSQWSESLRKQWPEGVTLRFFVGDAISFAHTLQQRRNAGTFTSASWYRSRFESFDPLILNEAEYGPNGDAPVSFTSVETSNLIDHLGSINLLVATSPLLDGAPSSTLYTESLVKKSETHRAFSQTLFGTNLGFFSLLLGLFPVDYWTNTTSVCAGDEGIIDRLVQSRSHLGSKPPPGQLHIRMGWKRPPGPSHIKPQPTSTSLEYLNMDASNLAELLFKVYLNMFPHENVTAMMSALRLGGSPDLSLPVYCRASFAALLRLVKSRVKTDWPAMMSQLIGLIGSDTTLTMGANYHHELLMYIHLLGVCPVSELAASPNSSGSARAQGKLRGWKDIPSTVCLTLKVPRSRLGLFAETGGALPVQCLVQDSAASKWMNMFAAVQLGFGTIKTSGTPYTDTFSLQIQDDPEGWHGSSALFVSFRAPTWILLQEPETATVAFALQHNLSTTQAYGRRLGAQLIVFGTKLGDTNAVFVTKEPPNLEGAISSGCFGIEDFLEPSVLNPGAKSSTVASTDGESATLTCRIDLESQDLKSTLSSGCAVKPTASSCCVWDVEMGDKSLKAIFPLPVLVSSIKTRIARKSSYIELIGTVITEISKTPSVPFTYPIVFSQGSTSSRPVPTPWNMPRLHLAILPAINIDEKSRAALSWVNMHLGHMWSSHERLLRENPWKPVSKEERARVNFKDSLFTIMMQFAGLKDAKGEALRSSVFALNCKEADGVNMAIFVSAMRLDLSNRTLVLDAAVMPALNELAEPHARIIQDMMKTNKLVGVNVTLDELRLWKEALPSMVERCREWDHKEDCEYLKSGEPRAPPLSIGTGERIICDCGVGVFPQDYHVDYMGSSWKHARKHCVRAAISPMFASSLVDELLLPPALNDLPTPSMAPVVAPASTTTRQAIPSIPVQGSGKDQCDVCWAGKRDDGGELFKCSKCKKVKYCSRECQKIDWQDHKKVCK
ncbi:hypothetical protein QBC41DRAFT_366638 [Cercophora samala]|uniref:MYND-type domain-containing protein n=1 Tax=Cercophora samala TaxID=330535 RepID=A0AA40D8C3_9PEZI|nr:hypothetical protein QBC41DRAFT_366638 [Cercophora samala]